MSQPTSQSAPIRPRLEPLPVDRAMLLPAKLRWEVVARYRSQGAFAAAAELLDEIERQSRDSATLLEERARLAYAQEDYETAIEVLGERVERQPSATSWVGLGRLHLEIGDLERAQEIAEELGRSSGGLMTVAVFLAEVERAAGDLATARGRYRRILADKPDHVATLLALAGLELEEGDERAARHFADQAIVALGDGGTPTQLSAAAGVAEALGNLDRAGELRGRALAAEGARVRFIEGEIAKALGDDGPDDGEPLWPAPPDHRAWTPEPRRTDAPDGRTAEPVRDRARSTATEAAPEPEPAPPDPEPDVEALFPGTLDALRQLFGFDDFRPGQAAVVANVLARRDTLATMPTGAGKSLTFQLPAMRLDGVTLVMSPLIALMKDQVEGLPDAIRERTALVNSTLSPDEMRRTLDELADGRFKLVYAAPERLRHQAFLRALRAAGVGLVVIDEAHCISLWGHDFRPDYLAIPKALPDLGEPPILAITATATPPMARAIGGGLGRDLDRVRASVFRPNLFYETYRCANREEKVKRVVQICHEQRRKGEGCGIVYVSSRKDAEQIAGVLRDRGIGAIPYHAGLEAGARSRNQEAFMRGDPRSSVVVATVAFGMGVNKADVRFIVHLSPPRSLEAYAQESGRAGRDGKPARCALLFAPADQTSLKRLAKRDMLDLDDLRPVYAGIKRAAVGKWAIVDPSGLIPPPGPDDDPDDAVDPRVALGILEQSGLVFRHPDAPVARFLRPLPPATPAADALPDEDVERWLRFKTWAGIADSARPLSVQTDEALAALDLAPSDLERLLGAQAEYAVRDDRRAVCLELLPAGADAAANLRQVLERAKIEANRRIDQVMAYAAGRACRHATLAAHLGERLAPCRTACDVCAPTAPEVASPGRPRPTAEADAPKRSTITADDARAVLQAVRTLPFPMGKTGLVKLLIGSIESRVRDDRSASFGALAPLPKARIDELIDRMVDDGLLEKVPQQGANRDFNAIRLAPLGDSATDEMLEAYATPVRARSTPAVASRSHYAAEDPTELGPVDAVLYDRLVAWRRQRASEVAMPPYVIAHDRTLREIASILPASHDELTRVHGMGQSRVERYGDELLALVSEAAE